jgi:hypothetical protein
MHPRGVARRIERAIVTAAPGTPPHAVSELHLRDLPSTAVLVRSGSARMAKRNHRGTWRHLIVTVWSLVSCIGSEGPEDSCRSRYPNPTDAVLARNEVVRPALQTLPIYSPGDTLPQIYNSDSTVAWYRTLFLADFDRFPNGPSAVQSFLQRFNARIVGRAETAGWYAITIPDPGLDTATFSLLLRCIGATHGVYVHSVYSRPPKFFQPGN